MRGNHRPHSLFAAGIVASFCLMSSAMAAPAAPPSGTVTGHVKDAQGQPVAGVAVALLKAGKVIPQQTAGADGNVRFGDLASGVYSASASLEGYAPVDCPGVRIIAGQTRHLEITLSAASEGGPPSTCAIVDPK
jgi:Carboxypeptidase regulatory-like domain